MDDSRTRAQVEADIERSRAELERTVEELRQAVSPAAISARAQRAAKDTASGAADFVTGKGLPEDEIEAKRVKIALGAAAGVVAVIGLKALRRGKRK